MKRINTLLSNISGICITETPLGCLCESSTANSCINAGFFVEGSTCSYSTTHLGSCCMKDKENNTVIPCQKASFCDCNALANTFNFKTIWTPFTSTQSCSDFDCVASFRDIGACCNGHGLCEEFSKDECEKSKGFFHGNGTLCVSDKINVCYGGTGACCSPGISCSNGVAGSSCLSEKKLYFGNNKKCHEFITEEYALPCYSMLPGYRLHVGDVVEDCMVVGIYKPEGTKCLGNPIFGGSTSFDSLISNTSSLCSPYYSSTDYNGYGEVVDGLPCNTEYSYIMLLSLHDASLDGKYDFTWSHGGLYFGPLISTSGRITETDSKNIKNTKEGYIIDSNFTLDENKNEIISNSKSSCKDKRSRNDTPHERAIRNSEHNFNGRWSSDWGLYNTIRMNNADIFYSLGISFDAHIGSSHYSPSVDFNTTMVPCIGAIQELNRNTIDNDNISKHVIPSINELAYITEQCSSNNLNTKLLMAGGSPIVGKYWSSTGSFNYTGFSGPEGVYDGVSAAPGSMAWTITHTPQNYIIGKTNRLNTNKIRTIRIIRCDGKQNFNSTLRKVINK